jgi:hypothetical protein
MFEGLVTNEQRRAKRGCVKRQRTCLAPRYVEDLMFVLGTIRNPWWFLSREIDFISR